MVCFCKDSRKIKEGLRAGCCGPGSPAGTSGSLPGRLLRLMPQKPGLDGTGGFPTVEFRRT
eukprot:8897583-Pyramimonas_sp.AAC.1